MEELREYRAALNPSQARTQLTGSELDAALRGGRGASGLLGGQYDVRRSGPKLRPQRNDLAPRLMSSSRSAHHCLIHPLVPKFRPRMSAADGVALDMGELRFDCVRVPLAAFVEDRRRGSAEAMGSHFVLRIAEAAQRGVEGVF